MIRKIATLVIACIALQACAATDRLAQVGRTPAMTPIENPAVLAGTGPSQIPMPVMPGRLPATQTNSLWSANSPTFFGDPRAARVGDILTVKIDISDSAQLNNTTSRSRDASEDSDLTQFFGLDLTNVFGSRVDPTSLTSLGSASSTTGTGTVNRGESISLTIAAIVTQVLPNGNLVLAGRQEVRVNNEVRELLISGIARPQDIGSDNTISHTQIAEARISYGGRGHLSEVQRPSYGQELYDILMPF
ncbi:flagellar basal body L-ring protein FlgH [uncultured Maricaulis sp.]|uniref:flagellar basal body L-ring protein FlgH n=1 Tax=uncultured Maricaulis sp. TaxID=174710 RepID=UPI0030DA9D03|tara:strand:+ start:24898 stop:25638 length:741 start_codon:yes stop_codon:yes gene_type:complete